MLDMVSYMKEKFSFRGKLLKNSCLKLTNNLPIMMANVQATVLAADALFNVTLLAIPIYVF